MLVDFSYEALSKDKVNQLKTAASRIRQRARISVENLFLVGKELLEARKLFSTDKAFNAWLRYEFQMPRTTAWRLMNVTERYYDDRSNLEQLSLTALYELASPSLPEGLRNIVEERVVAGGEVVSAEEIRRLRDENAELSDTVVELQTQAKIREIPSVVTIQPNHEALEKQYQAFVAHWQSLTMDLRERFWREFKTPLAARFSAYAVPMDMTSNSYGSNGSGH